MSKQGLWVYVPWIVKSNAKLCDFINDIDKVSTGFNKNYSCNTNYDYYSFAGANDVSISFHENVLIDWVNDNELESESEHKSSSDRSSLQEKLVCFKRIHLKKWMIKSLKQLQILLI